MTVMQTSAGSHAQRTLNSNSQIRGGYTYTRLQPGTIRLFYVEPPQNEDNGITGSLKSDFLLGRAAYFTLSYAWGPTYEDDSHLTARIVCDGQYLRVTETLKRALCRIRSVLWSDVHETRWYAADDILNRSGGINRPIPFYLIMGGSICSQTNFVHTLKHYSLLDDAGSFKELLYTGNRANPVRIMYTFDRSKCSDPRDYVYALAHAASGGTK